MSHYENVPFEVPEGWCWCSLDDLCTIINGNTVDKSLEKEEGQIAYLRVGDMNLVENKVEIVTSKTYLDNPSNIVPINSFIFPKRGGAILTNKKRKVKQRPIWIDLNLMAVNVILPDLFEYIFLHFSSIDLGSICNGGNIPQINTNDIAKIFIPLPPLLEQNRIVVAVEQWMSFVDSIESCTTDLLQSVQSTKSKILDLAIRGKLVPQNASDEPAFELLKRINPKAIASCDNPQYGKVPSLWVISTVGEVFTINPKTHVEDDTDAAFVPMTCVADEYSNTFEYECRKWGDIKKGFVHFQDNDVAVAKISPCLENRKSVVFHDLPNGIGAGTTELNVFRCADIIPEYALFYFKSQMFIGSCAGTYNGVVGQQRVAKSFIQELPFGIPPYKEQLRIVSKVNELFSQLDMIEKSLQA